jgi:hypothetical protein
MVAAVVSNAKQTETDDVQTEVSRSRVFSKKPGFYSTVICFE